jgi:putative methionine-R-sulfoxide reductase with GAF domain
MNKLHVLNGPEMGQAFELNDAPTYVGRSEDNDIQIENKSVSRRHLRIVQRENRFFVTDLQSENGTFIGGNLIPPSLEVEVEEGRPITIGMCMICLGEAPPEQAMPFLDAIGFTEDTAGDTGTFAARRDKTNQKNLEFLSNVSRVIEEDLPIHKILEKILEHIFDLLKRIDRVAFILVDPETEEVLDVVSKSKKPTADAYCIDVVKRVLEERKPVALTNVQTEKNGGLVDTLRILKIESVMCIPMFSHSQPIGLIYVDSLERPHGFRKDDLSLFTELSQIAAPSVQRARFASESTRGGDTLRLELCYKLAEKERDTYPPHIRESLDKIFLKLIDMCEKSKNLTIEDLKPECKHIAESINDVEWTELVREY